MSTHEGTLGDWDCANKECSTYHEMRRRPFRDHMSSPPCSTCKQPLRLVRVIRTMDPKLKQRLRDLNRTRKEPV